MPSVLYLFRCSMSYHMKSHVGRCSMARARLPGSEQVHSRSTFPTRLTSVCPWPASAPAAARLLALASVHTRLTIPLASSLAWLSSCARVPTLWGVSGTVTVVRRCCAHMCPPSTWLQVGRSLEGQRLASFTGVGAFVRRAFEEALSGILHKRQVRALSWNHLIHRCSPTSCTSGLVPVWNQVISR